MIQLPTLTENQANNLIACLDEARKCDDLHLARLAFAFIDMVMAAAQKAQESLKPNGHAESHAVAATSRD